MRRGAIAQSQSLLLVAALASMGCSLALTIVAGRMLPPAAFGVFALIAAIFALARDATDLGTTAIACRATACDPASEVTALEDLRRWRLVPCALIAGACVYLGSRRSDMVEAALFAATGAVILYANGNALLAVFQVRQAQRIPARITIVTQAVLLGLVGGGAAAGWLATPAWLFLPALLIVREAVAIAWTQHAAARLLGTMPRLRIAAGEWRRVLAGGISVYALAALCLQLVLNSGTFLINFVGNPAELGVYAAAYRPMTPLFGLCWLLAAPLSPILSHLAAHAPVKFRRQVDGAVGLALGGGVVLAGTGMVLAPEIARFFYGAAVDARTIACLAALMPAVPVMALLAVLAPASLAQHRERSVLYVALAAVALGLVATPIAIVRAGPVGAALSITGALSLAGGVLLGVVRPSLRHVVLALVPAGVATGALLAILPLLPALPWVRIASGAVTAALALAGLWCAPGMAAYRREQDAAAARLGAGDGG